MRPSSAKTLSTLLLLLLAGIAGMGVSAAEKGYYKWMDSRGNPQHSDRPPPTGVEYEFISTDSGLSRRVSSEESKAENRPAQQNTPGSAEDAMDELEKSTAIEKNPALCDQARANLDTLNSKARVRIRDADGTIRYLTEEEKDVQRQKARDLMAVHCP